MKPDLHVHAFLVERRPRQCQWLWLLSFLLMAIGPRLEACAVKAQVEVSPTPNPGCIMDGFSTTLTADFTELPTVSKECRITGMEWQWTVEKVLYSECSSSPSDMTAQKKPFITIVQPTQATTAVTVSNGAFNKPGKWTVTFKVVGTVHTTNCGDCTASDTVSPDFHVVDFDIQINNTASTDDDYVQVHDPVCNTNFTTPCQVKVLGCPPSDVSVTLKNPDGRLGITPATLTLPSAGTWVPFSITGKSKSSSVNDAKIELHMGSNSEVCKQANATVFYFSGKLTLTPGSPFRRDDDGVSGITTFQALPPPAIRMSAQASLKPDSSNCSAPQVSPWKIGLVQNLVGAYQGNTLYRVQRVVFLPTVPHHTLTTVATRLSIDRSVTPPANDTDATDDPFYDKSTIQSPTSCGGGNSNSSDSPSGQSLLQIQLAALDSNGNRVGTVFYGITRIHMKRNWTTWCAAWDSSAGGIHVVPLRQADWHINVYSDAEDKATAGADRDASDCPLTGPPYANDLTPNITINDIGMSTYRSP